MIEFEAALDGIDPLQDQTVRVAKLESRIVQLEEIAKRADDLENTHPD